MTAYGNYLHMQCDSVTLKAVTYIINRPFQHW